MSQAKYAFVAPFDDLRISATCEADELSQQPVSGRTTTTRYVGCLFVQPPVLLNYRLDNDINPLFKNHRSPLLAEQAELHRDPQLTSLSRLMQYFSVETMMTVMRDANRRIDNHGLLSEEEIKYFKQNGNNATLFIHGYNVPYGEYGKQIDADYDKPEQPRYNHMATNGVPVKQPWAPYTYKVVDFNQATLKAALQFTVDKQSFTAGYPYPEEINRHIKHVDDANETYTAPNTIDRVRLYLTDKPAKIYRDLATLVYQFPQAVNDVLSWQGSHKILHVYTDETAANTPPSWLAWRIAYAALSPWAGATLSEPLTQTFTSASTFSAASDLDFLNGNGMHNWFLNIEYQLNVAAGFTGLPEKVLDKPGHGIDYTRIIAIAWQGNPVSALDYAAVEHMAMATAPLVANVLKQLHAAGIAINVIAHSAGNCLLLYALELLGREGQTGIVNNAFMWEAAIPNTALSNNPKADTSLRQHWPTTHAYQAAQTFHVLYSEHDNILGPFPTMGGSVVSQLPAKFNTPSSGETMAAQAYLIDAIDSLGIPNPLQSPYHAAQQFGYPLDGLLFNDIARDHAYRDWMRLYQDTSANNAFLGRVAYGETLVEQTQRLLTHYDDKVKHAVEHAAVIVGCIHAIAQGCERDYLADKTVQARLRQLATAIGEQTDSLVDKLAARLQVVLPSRFLRDVISVLADGLLTDDLFAEAEHHTEVMISSPLWVTLATLLDSAASKGDADWDATDGRWLFRRVLHTMQEAVAQLAHLGDMFDTGQVPALLQTLFDRIGAASKPRLEHVLNTPEWGQRKEREKKLTEWHDKITIFTIQVEAGDDSNKAELSELKGQYQQTLRKQVQDAIQAGEQMAVLMVTVLSATDAVPVAAMGYDGVDIINNTFFNHLHEQGKLNIVNGTKWLFTHSAMHYPSPDVFKYLYKGAIIGSPSMQFGQYDLIPLQNQGS
tara:strand:+ start:4921 stop:7755 length:2835 start_codon:yes stop_codon:yes gene_type:complete